MTRNNILSFTDFSSPLPSFYFQFKEAFFLLLLIFIAISATAKAAGCKFSSDSKIVFDEDGKFLQFWDLKDNEQYWLDEVPVLPHLDEFRFKVKNKIKTDSIAIIKRQREFESPLYGRSSWHRKNGTCL